MAESRTFASELRQRRYAAGLSLAQLAALTHYSKGYLSKIENGDKSPNATLARLCDAALGAGGALAALAGNDRKTKPSDGGAQEQNCSRPLNWPATNDECHPLTECLDWPAVQSAGLSRFELTARQTVAAAANDGVVTTFRTLFREYVKLGLSAGGSTVLPGVIAHLNTLRTLADQATGAYREQFLHLVALYASFAGIAAHETGAQNAARRWASMSTSVADVINVAGLSAYTRILEVELALDREDSSHAITVSERAQHDDTATARLKGMVVVREARAYAQISDFEQCERALDRAGAWLDGAEPVVLDGLIVDQIDGTHVHRVWTAWCLLDLGQPGRAAALLDEEVAQIPSALRRDRSRFDLRRALAHAAAGDVGHACEVATPLLEALASLNSVSIRHDLHVLVRTLGRWRTHRPARELSAQLRMILRSLAPSAPS